MALRVVKKREAALISQNQKTGVRQASFTVVYYMLHGPGLWARRLNPSLTENNLYYVKTCHLDYVFEIENPFTCKRQNPHGRRPKLARKNDFEISKDPSSYIEYQKSDLVITEKFGNIYRAADKVRPLVKWRRLEQRKDLISLLSLPKIIFARLEQYIRI